MNVKYKKVEDIKRSAGFEPVILRQNETKSILFYRGKSSNSFFTEDSGLYITPLEKRLLDAGIKLNREKAGRWDSLSSRIIKRYVRYQPARSTLLYDLAKKKIDDINESVAQTADGFLAQFSLVKAWNFSILCSILFGMIIMTFVYRYLGQGAAADQVAMSSSAAQVQTGRVLGAEDTAKSNDDSFTKQVLEIENANEKTFEKEIRAMVKGYPIEKMVPYIAKKDRTVAAFLVAIAKKESDWGKHAPVLNGQDCYNYWGYRGQRKLMGSGGHTCFNGPKDAVDTVSKRLETLIEKYNNDTPAEMVEPWKCGYDCAATGGRAAANKWVYDVSKYFNELND